MTKKLCKDCKWYRKDWVHHIVNGTSDFDRCASPNTTDDLVSGYQQRFCNMLRKIEDLDYACGRDGRFWEEKNESCSIKKSHRSEWDGVGYWSRSLDKW